MNKIQSRYGRSYPDVRPIDETWASKPLPVRAAISQSAVWARDSPGVNRIFTGVEREKCPGGVDQVRFGATFRQAMR
ncbi:MAG: hypothetical protein AMXMBFR47_04010 [Planctomycetota bacterium]